MKKEFNQKEAERLVDYFRGKNIHSSSELSRYIRTHNLRDMWPNITGYLEMEDRYSSDVWTFDGGIAPAYFAYVCRELGFSRNGKDAYVIGFKPYAQCA